MLRTRLEVVREVVIGNLLSRRLFREL